MRTKSSVAQEKEMTETKTFISFDALAKKRAARLAAGRPLIKAKANSKSDSQTEKVRDNSKENQ